MNETRWTQDRTTSKVKPENVSHLLVADCIKKISPFGPLFLTALGQNKKNQSINNHIKIQNSGQFNREILEQIPQSILKVEVAQWRSEQYGNSFKLQACGHIRQMQNRTHSNHSMDI